MKLSRTRAIFFAILAAALYALMTPVSKLMQLSVPPVMEAGLLYLGAGVGMSLIYILGKDRGTGASRPSVGKEDLRFVIMMVILDIAAPIFLMLGLSMSLFFKEKISGRRAVSIIVITVSCLILSVYEGAELSLSRGSLFVLLACVCWGLENNCTSSLSDKDTRQIVMIKGLGSGAASFVISMIVGEKIPGFGDMLLIMLLGFLAIGLGVYFYVLAQSVIGAARTSSYYAVSPFIGVLLSLIIFREIPGVLFWIALLVMALGVYLNVTEES